MEMELLGTGFTVATVQIRSVNADSVMIYATEDKAVPAAEKVAAEGFSARDGQVEVPGLTAGKTYRIHAVACGYGKLSRVQTVVAKTQDPPDYDDGDRKEIPKLADLTLCTGGGRPNSNQWFSIPYYWNKDRFAPHVSYTDSEGEHWLFDAFLSISGVDASGKSFTIANGPRSADKASWQSFIDYWLGVGGAFDQLDNQIEEVSRRIGVPAHRRYVVMTMPSPICFEYFSDKNSSTTYWGQLDGRTLDFRNVADQIAALEWYVDEVRARFKALNPKHLELAGLYILQEELVAKSSGWNYQYKRWDKILPAVSQYLHSHYEGLYWIPYIVKDGSGAGADGVDIWRSLGIDQAWLQLGHYWDNSNMKPLSKTVQTLKDSGMGIELEFEYSMVNGVMSADYGYSGPCYGPDDHGGLTFTAEDVPMLRQRLRDYMDSFVDAGLYGQRGIALYSGSNALWQLATSKDAGDRAMYLELCSFIADNPLKAN